MSTFWVQTFVLSMGKSFFSYAIPINVVAYLFDLMYLLDLISLDEKVWTNLFSNIVNLSIEGIRLHEVFDFDWVIELFTPKLQSFSYCDTDLYDFSMKVNWSFVEKVDITMDCLTTHADFSIRLIELFKVMASVYSLYPYHLRSLK